MKSTIQFILFNLFLTTTLIAQDAEFGIASYYSDLFQGKPTASGELYDKTKMTAAHKTLPFGTLARVTDLESKKSVQVRINDRGPFISGRIIELSKEAAKRIGLVQKGVARVKVEIVKTPPANDAVAETTPPKTPQSFDKPQPKIEKKKQPKPAPKTGKDKVAAKSVPQKAKINEKPGKEKQPASTPKAQSILVNASNFSPVGLYEIELRTPATKGFGVQVAALTTQTALFKKLAELQGEWFDKVLVQIEAGKNDQMKYRVLLGNFPTREAAENYRTNLKKNKKIKGFVVDLSSFEK